MKIINFKDLKIIGVVIVFALSMLAYFSYKKKQDLEFINRISIDFFDFEENKIIDTTYFILKGTINDSTCVLNVKNGQLLSYSNGYFSILLENQTESDAFLEIILINGSASRIVKKNYKIKFNNATKIYLEKSHALEAKRKKEEEKAEYMSNVKIFGKKAAKIKSRFPEWSWEDCGNLAKNKIWIGMDVRMLIYLRGRDFHKNVSNYGNGDKYQYCWLDYNPSCFYDNDGDGKIESYN
jgi:hypothetical protein